MKKAFLLAALVFLSSATRVLAIGEKDTLVTGFKVAENKAIFYLSPLIVDSFNNETSYGYVGVIPSYYKTYIAKADSNALALFANLDLSKVNELWTNKFVAGFEAIDSSISSPDDGFFTSRNHYEKELHLDKQKAQLFVVESSTHTKEIWSWKTWTVLFLVVLVIRFAQKLRREKLNILQRKDDGLNALLSIVWFLGWILCLVALVFCLNETQVVTKYGGLMITVQGKILGWASLVALVARFWVYVFIVDGHDDALIDKPLEFPWVSLCEALVFSVVLVVFSLSVVVAVVTALLLLIVGILSFEILKTQKNRFKKQV